MGSVFPLDGKKIFVAGHRGMVGAAVVRRLARENCEIVTASRAELDLREQDAVHEFMQRERPDAVIMAAAKVGGIRANDSYPADFLFDNLAIQNSLIHAAFKASTQKLLFLGSSCIYPKFAPQPIPEEALLTGALEPTNESYAIAKIAGLKMCEAYRKQHGVDYISAMPSNLYGPGDNYDREKSHVVPALIRKAHEAKIRGDKTLPIWGTGSPRREFLHVDDAADALVFLLSSYSDAQHVNVGLGEDVTILELAQMICEVVGLDAEIVTDPTQADGTPRKLMNVEKLFGMGWRPRYGLKEGLRHAYETFVSELDEQSARLSVA